MRFSTSLSVAILLLCAFAQAREKKEPNPNLVNIRELFIKGNNEAATEARKRLLVPRDKAVTVYCFGLVGNEAMADGTLEISQDTAPDGAVTVSGTITDRAGNLLWSDSKQSHMIPPDISAANMATYHLMYGLKDEMCGVPPLIELSNVRKIYVDSFFREHVNNVTWESGCLRFVKILVDADAELYPASRTTRKGIPILMWVLFDPRNDDEIPGWETEPKSFRGVADLEGAVGCR
jgi:hypothetical protein